MFENVIQHYPDFPKPGIDFIDVLPFLGNKEAFMRAVAEIDALCTAPNVATVEARGFLFAAPLLTVSSHVENIIAIRKKGKLPHVAGDLRKVEIEKEYGSDEVFYRLSDLQKAVATGDILEITLFDDLLATGGTALSLAQALQSEVVDGKHVRVKEFVFLVELPDLHGRAALETIAPVHALMQVAGA